ncbi:hypothetical protein KIPB_006015 [Kipferlia bialata]|uniref:Pentapeptide repeat-containing protein n=1 Tax=Kipferlia bialata TaxID=797122 RepID=A0A391NLV3_9EUKA|nr:hypothetical protein KIPB_006015 [Kipferlia bialata]|eukprot:g6015.t1
MSLQALDLRDTDASGSVFTKCDLTTANVTGANLSTCDLSKTNLSGVLGLSEWQLKSLGRVRGATISGMDMRGWDLSQVDLRETDLTGCIMTGATTSRHLLDAASSGRSYPASERECTNH